MPSLTEADVTDHLKHGKPLLAWDTLSLDWQEVQALFGRVITLLVENLSPAAEEIGNLNELAADRVCLEGAVRAWFEHGTPSLEGKALDNEFKPLVAGAIQASLQPFLAVCSEKLLHLIDQELWYRGYCPVCGGEPDFAFLDRDRGARWLLCSRCDAQWLFYRIRCPFCDNQDPGSLAYFGDDKGLYRLHVCEQCHRYLKAIDLRHAEGEVLLPLERVLTLDMDVQACQMGYRAGG